MTRSQASGRSVRRRALVTTVCFVLALGLVPVPFNVVFADEPVATVWRLDGRLQVNGRTANPEGRWSFVAIGRPELFAETLTKRVRGRDTSRNVRGGPLQQRPIFAEPLAVAAGLRQAGHTLRVQPVLFVEELANPANGLTLVAVNGSQDALVELLSKLRDMPIETVITDAVVFTTNHGETVRFTTEERVVRRFRPGELLLDDVQAKIRWRSQRYVPQTWFRSLAVGNSHGLMVALVAYADAVDPTLARGLHVAGTGVVQTDGTVLNVGGLNAKAKAAQRAGADVFFFPATQQDALEQADVPGMVFVPVEHINDALAWLSAFRQNGQ